VANRAMLTMLAGPMLTAYLDDPTITDICCNDNGSCFVRVLGQGKQERPHPGFAALDVFLAGIADAAGAEWRDSAPCMSAALEDLGWRIEAAMPPVCPAPWMALRKHPKHVFPLEQLQGDGILTTPQYTVLTQALHDGARIIIGGGVGSAKTSLLNSCLHYLRDTGKRVFICEDNPEILCTIKDCSRRWGGQGLREMVRSSLRTNLDLLVVGEVRGPEAIEMLEGFQTGHGGMTTVHVNSMPEIPERLEQLVLVTSVHPQRRLICSVLDLLVHMERTTDSWRCTGMGRLQGYQNEQYLIERVA
jgi:type IV secretion system protein TrbB